MASPDKGIQDILVSEGYPEGGSSDWAVYLGRRPDKPDRVITVYNSGGTAPNPRWLLDFPGVQIRVRGGANDYVAAQNQSKAIKDHLLGRPSFDLNGDRWDHINMTGDISFLGYDETNRPEFVMNLALIIEPANTPDDHRDPL